MNEKTELIDGEHIIDRIVTVDTEIIVHISTKLVASITIK